MASYTYPVARPEGTLTTAQIHLLLSSNRLIAKRLADLTKMGFIADYLLPGRYVAERGGVFYETGEEIFTSDAPEAVAPGSGYPKTVMTQGEIAAAKTIKWGLESDITDEKIKREGRAVMDRGLRRLGNSIIRTVDSVAMAVISSKVSSTFASPAGAWDSAGAIAEALLGAQQARSELGLGITLDTVVLKPAHWAKLYGMLIDDKALPRENGNVVVDGLAPFNALGFTWATSPYFTANNPLFVDREELGGMADEDLESPDYAKSGDIDAYTNRETTDGYVIRGRRVTVPVVTEPLAGVSITSTGLS